MKNIRHQVVPHFSVEALKQKYLNCDHPRERTHWHIIWLLAQTDTPRMPREVATIVGCTPDCVRKLLRRYNAQGEDALRDKRKNNSAPRCLDKAQQQMLETALLSLPADGGLWTSPQSCRLDIRGAWTTCQRGDRMEVSQTARFYPTDPPAATSDSGIARGTAGLKKKLAERVAVPRREPPDQAVEVWAEAEIRLGLRPVHRRVWAKQGARPIAPVCLQHKWLYGFGFVRPKTGETYGLLMPTVSINVMNLALAEFARDVNPCAKKQIVLVVDCAGFHTSKALEVPAGVELFIYRLIRRSYNLRNGFGCWFVRLWPTGFGKRSQILREFF